MGIELRIREPSAAGAAPFRLLAAELFVDDDADAFLAGVSSTSFRNCELFMMMSFLWWRWSGVEWNSSGPRGSLTASWEKL
jgi:hypothetical protein